MCTSTASGRGRAQLRRQRAREPERRGRAACARRRRARARSRAASWRPDRAQSTTTVRRAAPAHRTRSTVWARAGCSASSVCVTKTSRISGRCPRDPRRRALASPLRAPPASSATRRSAALRRRPEPFREGAVGEHALDRGRERCHVRRRDQAVPRRSSRDEVGNPTRVRRDHASAARERLDHDPAEPLRPRRAARAASRRRARGDLVGIEPGVMARRGRDSRRPGVDDAAREPAPTTTSARVRHAVGEAAPRRGQPVDVLVRLERSDEERPSAARAAARGGRSAKAERSLKAREDGASAAARGLPRSAAGECRDGPRRVGVANRGLCDAVCQRRHEPARRATRTAA